MREENTHHFVPLKTLHTRYNHVKTHTITTLNLIVRNRTEERQVERNDKGRGVHQQGRSYSRTGNESIILGIGGERGGGGGAARDMNSRKGSRGEGRRER